MFFKPLQYHVRTSTSSHHSNVHMFDSVICVLKLVYDNFIKDEQKHYCMGGCIYCKQKDTARCTRSFCPSNGRYEFFFKSKQLSESYSGAAPAPFIGRGGDPRINAGFLFSPDI